LSNYVLLSPTNVVGTLPPAPIARPISPSQLHSLQVINGNPMDPNLPVTPPGQQSFQLVVKGTGAVSAQAQIYGSNTGLDWATVGAPITANGTTKATVVANGTVPFAFFGALLTAISGTNAIASVTMSC
jgi:hypothetical protein